MSRKITVRSCILLCIFVSLFTATLFGSGVTEKITATLNKEIKILIDGETQELKDVQGNPVYLLTYNGTTYAPIRGLGTLFGYEIDWDSNTGNVLLYTDKVKNYLVTKEMKSTKYNEVITDNIKELEGSSLYKNAIKAVLQENVGFNQNDYVNIPIGKGLTNINFVGYSKYKCSINVFNQQGKLLKTFYLEPNKNKTCDIYLDDMTTSIYFVCVNQESTLVKDSTVILYDVMGR